MQHDEKRCIADAVMGERKINSTDVAGGISGIDAIRDQSDEARAVRY